jgi:uncharacterized protein (TIRG00374 family)
LQIATSIGASVFFLWLALKGEDWAEIATGLQDARYEYLAGMFVVGIYALFVRTQRWRLLLNAATARPQPLGPLFSASAIGFMANMLLPLRVGEFIRPYLASRATAVPLSTVLATAVIERVLDLMALVVFGFYVINHADVPAIVGRLTTVAAVVMAVAFGGLLVVHFQRDRLLPHLDRLWGKLPERIGKTLISVEHDFLDGMAVVADPVVFAQAVAWSLYVWFIIAVGFALGFPATGLDLPFVGGGITTATIVALAVSVPGAPGFVGQFEYGCKIALEQIYGIDGSRAVAYALVTHATQFVTQVLLGVVYLLREGLSLGELGRISEQKTP